jgi:hypothetical protein
MKCSFIFALEKCEFSLYLALILILFPDLE